MICDGCGKDRKPYQQQVVYAYGEIDDRFEFCFLCVKQGERDLEKAYREAMENEGRSA